MIVPTTLFEKSKNDASQLRPTALLCSQLIAMAHNGFDTAILTGMQNTAFSSAAQLLLHAKAKGVQIDSVQFEDVLAQHVGPAATAPVSPAIIASYMSAAKMQHQIEARQLLADAVSLADISISDDSPASTERDLWVRACLHQLIEHSNTIGATMPMFANEQRAGIEHLLSRYPALTPALNEDATELQENEEANEYAPR